MNSNKKTVSLNPSLSQIHTFFFFLYLVTFVFLAAVCAFGFFEEPTLDSLFAALFVLTFVGAIAAAHRLAAEGARHGKPYGRRWSKIIGIVWLLGFPIGTILGAYVLRKTSEDRWVSEEDTNTDSPTTENSVSQ